jgi:electron transport complex protein RnfB
MNILFAVLTLGIMGAVFGLILAFASKVFAVQVDERIPLVLDALPGANCGGCGYAGCAALANAIVSGDMSTDSCPVSDSASRALIAEIMGTTDFSNIRLRAQVMCSGTFSLAQRKYDYRGAQDCLAAMRLAGGQRTCSYGCMGLGSCTAVCKFDAIHVVNGIARVDFEKCTGCGMCVRTCPKSIIRLIPASGSTWVGCMSKERGPGVRSFCDVGCIGCKLCEKACEFDAVKVVDNIAEIDYSKCTNCGACVAACPRKIIWNDEKQKELGGTLEAVIVKKNFV